MVVVGRGGWVAETINISEIASKVSKDIFQHFLWNIHPKRDDNFVCTNEAHTSEKGLLKATHPGDVVFHYQDPYLQRRIYLHTDLKSYADDSISPKRLKSALQSLCMTIECANQSKNWRELYSVDSNNAHEVRGLLFVHNYTKGYARSFNDAIRGVKLNTLPLAPGTQLHFLGPEDILRLYSIANDIIRLSYASELPSNYSFYYPDLMLFRRHGDVWNQPATIESLTGPYLIIKHGPDKASGPGYLIYYSRPTTTPEGLQYFLDSLSRYQMLESGERIRVRCTSSASTNIKSHLEIAKERYASNWGFEPARVAILNAIEIDVIASVTDTYNPGTTGWRE
jgi:hypothetical protein